MRIALVHDYLSQDGGAERTLLVLHKIWPEAPIYVLFHDKKKIKYLPTKNIRTTFLDKVPGIRKFYKFYVFLMPLATEKHDLSDYDLVISSTSAFAKGILTKPETIHISYCHTPTRYLWSDTHDYLKNLKFNFILNGFLNLLLHKLRLWDRMSADRVDIFIANSHHVSKRIKKYYHKKAQIIYPPVDIKSFFVSSKLGDYFLAGGRIVSYKRFDLLVETFNRLPNFKLKIFGCGPELQRIKKKAKSNIEFLGRISEHKKKQLYSQCLAFLNPQEEDFGLTMVEALASGRPVIAYAKGGALEIVNDKVGLLFKEQDWSSLLKVIINFKPENFSAVYIRNYAFKFDESKFIERIKQVVQENYKQQL